MRNGKTPTIMKKRTTSEEGILQKCRVRYISLSYFMEVIWG